MWTWVSWLVLLSIIAIVCAVTFITLLWAIRGSRSVGWVVLALVLSAAVTFPFHIALTTPVAGLSLDSVVVRKCHWELRP
jgi:hypothetical protein